MTIPQPETLYRFAMRAYNDMMSANPLFTLVSARKIFLNYFEIIVDMFAMCAYILINETENTKQPGDEMNLNQNDLEYIMDMMQQGKLTVDEANVEKVRMMRVQLVTAKIPAAVRRALNEAVKSGYLAHMPKKQNKPEAYYHPAFEYLAKQERRSHEISVLNALKSICC